jgi:hypothetical protein
MEKIGIDVHKVATQVCVLTETGEYEECRIRTERDMLTAFFGERPKACILLEAATESSLLGRKAYFAYVRSDQSLDRRRQLFRGGGDLPRGGSVFNPTAERLPSGVLGYELARTSCSCAWAVETRRAPRSRLSRAATMRAFARPMRACCCASSSGRGAQTFTRWFVGS